MREDCKFLSFKPVTLEMSHGKELANPSSQCSLKKEDVRKRIEIKQSYEQITNDNSPPNFECPFVYSEKTNCSECVCFEKI